MMGLGYDPVLSEGSLKPPIFLTSTFAFESAAAGKRFFEHITGKREGPADGLVYSRFNGPNQEILEDRLASGTAPTTASSFRAACRRSRPCSSRSSVRMMSSSIRVRSMPRPKR
jgi:cystathionine beta-lyase/cystathionine gamma-synthase